VARVKIYDIAIKVKRELSAGILRLSHDHRAPDSLAMNLGHESAVNIQYMQLVVRHALDGYSTLVSTDSQY
jgi:hypothetical protein